MQITRFLWMSANDSTIGSFYWYYAQLKISNVGLLIDIPYSWTKQLTSYTLIGHYSTPNKSTIISKINVPANGLETQCILNKSFSVITSTISPELLTQWLMEPGDSMPHSQGLSNNPSPETNQPSCWYLFL